MNKKDLRTPKFVSILIQILDNQSYKDIISYDKDGENIVIHQKELFEKQILLNHFKHNHLESFTRQMNNYGFQRIKNSFGNYEFKNPFFSKNNKKLITLVLKKKQQKVFIAQQFSTLRQELHKFSSDLDQFNFFASSYEKNSRFLGESQGKIMSEVLTIQSKRREMELLLQSFFQYQ